MRLKDTPIQPKLMMVMLVTSGAVLLLTCAAFFAYDVLTFRQTAVRQLSILGGIIGANSTAALAFGDPEAAGETLSALRAARYVTAAALYDRQGNLFAYYPEHASPEALPAAPAAPGYRFEQGRLAGFQPVVQGDEPLGNLYLQFSMEAMYARIRLYAVIAALIVAVSFLLAYLLSKVLQRQISGPILTLAETAQRVSDRQDYEVRAVRVGDDEVGRLTDAFNHMLTQIQERDRALRESEERTRLMIEGVKDYAILMLDPQGRIVNWNASVERIHGYAAEEILGQHVSRFYPEEEARAGEPERNLQVAAEQGRFACEGWRTRKDGSRFWASVVLTALHEDARLRGFSKVTRDVSERRQADVRLQTQLARLDLLNRITRAVSERQTLQSIFEVVVRSLEEHMPIAFGCVCLYEFEREVLVVSRAGDTNPALARSLGLEEGADLFVDRNGLSRALHGQLVYEPDTRRMEAPFLQRLAESGLQAVVLAPLQAEDRVFGVLVAARREADSFTSADCEFLLQLSEHVALAARQAQLHEALQQAYDDLRQTQQAVLQQERLRALGQMASGIAHDINNAISPVTLYTEALLETEPNLSERTRSYLETIQHGIDDVAATVSRMREFYRRREDQLILSTVNLNDLVHQVLDLTRARWSDMPQQRGVVIETKTELAPDLPPILGIESEIREALTNLIFNAVDAMPEGGRLTLRTQVTTASPGPGKALPRRYVALDVDDIGTGMDEETKRRCLEPFFTTKGDRGTGLGLAMVYGVVQRHGAELAITTAPGEGTTVRLRFPVSAAETPGLEPTEPARRLPRRLRILVVDDDPLILRSLRDTLEADGHVVLTANGGEEGLGAFHAAEQKGAPVSVVITDLGMPHMDGRQVAAAIKEAAPATPVLLLTGWGQRLLEDGEVPPHVDRVLTKPPRMRELREALDACCRHLGF